VAMTRFLFFEGFCDVAANATEFKTSIVTAQIRYVAGAPKRRTSRNHTLWKIGRG
jgi:hypothetical protein